MRTKLQRRGTYPAHLTLEACTNYPDPFAPTICVSRSLEARVPLAP